MAKIPDIDLVLAGGLAVAGLSALATRRRGGRFRALPGWTSFWVMLSGILVCLSRVHPWVAFFLLGGLMLVALRNYFFLVPLRPKDRYAILAAYGAVPLALGLAIVGSDETFLATVPIALFLVLPLLLSLGTTQPGWLDSNGRILLGVALFVFCAAHLVLLADRRPAGLPELFGVLVLGADLCQRIAGRYRGGAGWLRPSFGVAASAVLAAGLGFWLGPSCGVGDEDAARAGFLAALAVAMGAAVTDALVRDLGLTPPASGRGAFLDRLIPAVYAAPVFFHYLNHFA